MPDIILSVDGQNLVGQKNFDTDIVIGEVGEELFKKYLTKYKGLIFLRKSEGMDMKGWDLEFLFNGQRMKYEIKTDFFVSRERDTGNLFVEFYSRGVDSGIATTKADVWVNIFFHLNEMWIIMSERLRELIRDSNFRIAEWSGDSDSNTKGYLIPRNRYRNHFKVINYLTIKENQNDTKASH